MKKAERREERSKEPPRKKVALTSISMILPMQIVKKVNVAAWWVSLLPDTMRATYPKSFPNHTLLISPVLCMKMFSGSFSHQRFYSDCFVFLFLCVFSACCLNVASQAATLLD